MGLKNITELLKKSLTSQFRCLMALGAFQTAQFQSSGLTAKLLLALASTVILGSKSQGLMTIFYCLMHLGAFGIPALLPLHSHTGVFLYEVGIGPVENTTHYCSSIVAVGTCLFAKPLLSNGCCIFAYSVAVV
jgi:hypothetical protein